MLDVAILGFGTIGSGVFEVIDKNADMISQNAAQEIRVKYIVDIRDFTGSPYEKYVTKDFTVVENDPDVKIVVETIGGVGVALDYTRRSLMKGKSVVTSNKELVANYGCELTKLAAANGVNYLFEASVGGGIPIIRPLTQCLAANKINEIYGILNGTTNYILTAMVKEGRSFEDALKGAQVLGYAEANPESDIKGFDVCRKICILSALSFGHHVYPKQVATEGIEAITLEDIGCADRLGYKIKLLGRAIHMDDGRVAVYVAPHLVSNDNLVASVEGVMNGIVVRGNAIGDVMFYGAGAGKLPTASAVVADVIDAAKHMNARKWLSWADGSDELIYPADNLETPWYIRTTADDKQLEALLGPVSGLKRLGGDDLGGGKALITPAMSKTRMDELKKQLTVLSAFRVLQ